MAQKKKKWVLFKSTTTIPADVAGEKEDKSVPKGEKGNLPEGYAEFLISSGLAESCDAPKKPAKKTALLKSDQAVDDTAAKLAEAQVVVDEITAKMEAMSEGDDGWTELTGQLDDARAALAELQART